MACPGNELGPTGLGTLSTNVSIDGSIAVSEALFVAIWTQLLSSPAA